MSTPNPFKIVLFIVSGLAIGLASYKYQLLKNEGPVFDAKATYQVTYRYFFKTDTTGAFVKAYLPKNSSRQKISQQKSAVSNTVSFATLADGENLKGQWKTQKVNTYESISYTFLFKGKDQFFGITEQFKPLPKEMEPYLAATANIQSDADQISTLAQQLKEGKENDKDVLQALFTYVNEIPSAPIITLTDALATLERNKASCNGKSRLLAALARNLGYPARIKGGIILKESNKRTSHAWTEIYINDNWVPFDALNGHFAFLPANYMELYQGDEFLVTHTPNIQFDYAYEIKKQATMAMLNAESKGAKTIAAFSLWGLVKEKSISKHNLFLLLLLPLGGLVVAFLRNVVGIRTFGVFLPVLIAFSLLETGFFTGMTLFLFLILFVGLITRPFDGMGLLHTPKLVISLTLMVLVMVVGNYIGIANGISWLTSLTLFPTIILTVSAERFSTLIVEDGLTKATGTLLQTLLAVGACFLLFSIRNLDTILILFPELLLLVIAVGMLLGRYVGLRWTELLRFRPLLMNQEVKVSF